MTLAAKGLLTTGRNSGHRLNPKAELYDYTKWRREIFGSATVPEINKAAAAYDREHPFQPVKPLGPV